MFIANTEEQLMPNSSASGQKWIVSKGQGSLTKFRNTLSAGAQAKEGKEQSSIIRQIAERSDGSKLQLFDDGRFIEVDRFGRVTALKSGLSFVFSYGPNGNIIEVKTPGSLHHKSFDNGKTWCIQMQNKKWMPVPYPFNPAVDDKGNFSFQVGTPTVSIIRKFDGSCIINSNNGQPSLKISKDDTVRTFFDKHGRRLVVKFNQDRTSIISLNDSEGNVFIRHSSASSWTVRTGDGREAELSHNLNPKVDDYGNLSYNLPDGNRCTRNFMQIQVD
jgi:hypothetical protein